MNTIVTAMKNIQICEGVEGTWHYHLCPLDDNTGTKSLCGLRTISSPAILSDWGFKPKHMPAYYCKECESIATSTTGNTLKRRKERP